MARGGINKALVQSARAALIARGEHPSIDAVRIELGNTGSKTTIHRYLKALEQPPQALSASLGRLVEQLAAQLQSEAQAGIDAAVQHQSQRLADALQAEQLRNKGLAQSLADRDEQLRDARQALERYQEQREQEQRRVETQVRQLQGQLQTLQLGTDQHRQEQTRLHRDNERLLAEQRHAAAQCKLLSEQLEQRDAQVQGLRAILAQAQGASEEMRRQLDAQRNPR